MTTPQPNTNLFSTQPSTGYYLVLISVLLLVLLAAFFTTRFVATRGRGYTRRRYLRLVESMMLGRDKSIVMLEVGETCYIVGITNQSMQLIGTINKADLPESTAEDVAENAFGIPDLFSRLAGRTKAFIASPDALQSARAQAQEQTMTDTALPNVPQPENKKAHGLLQFLRKPKKGDAAQGQNEKGDCISSGAAKEQPAQKPANVQSAFAKDLESANDRLLAPQHEGPGLIVELSSKEEGGGKKRRKKPGAKRTASAPATTQGDEIDKMMQSIVQRTQQLRKHTAKDNDNDELE